MKWIVQVPSPFHERMVDDVTIECDHVFHDIKIENGCLIFINNDQIIRAFSPGNWCSVREVDADE